MSASRFHLLSRSMRLADVIEQIEGIPMGGTDCALPMLWAARNKLDVSGFVTHMDSETWAGNIHPAQALRQYRSEPIGDAKEVVVDMTSDGFTLVHPTVPVVTLFANSERVKDAKKQRRRRRKLPPAISISIPLTEQPRQRSAKPQRLERFQHGFPFSQQRTNTSPRGACGRRQMLL